MKSSAQRASQLVGVVLTVCVLHGCAVIGDPGQRNSSSNSSQALFALLDQADAAYRTNQWEAATRHYQTVLQTVPDDAYVWFRLGNTLTQQQQYNQAIYAYEASLQRDAGQAKPWFNLSTTYLLGAQLATLRAWDVMGTDDPARPALRDRLEMLSRLLR